jgi:acetyl esterase/lipase
LSSLRLSAVRALYDASRRAGRRSVPLALGRARHKRKARRLRRLIGVPGGWARSRDPAGIRFVPEGTVEPGPELLFLHGGGYVHGSPASHAPFVARLARECARPVLAMRYPLAPEEPFPAALEAVVSALSTLEDRGDRGVVVVGESAGGGLALAAASRCRDEGLAGPAGLVPIAPWADLTGQRGVFADWAAAYAPPSRHEDPRVSPALGDARGLPPTHIHVGTADPLVGQAERLRDRLSSAGVACELHRWPGGFHGFHHYPVPESRSLAREIAAFVRGLASAGGTARRRSPP